MKITRRDFAFSSAAVALCPSWLPANAAKFRSEKTELWFAKPATRWMEAVPVGNGRIGGMVYGGTNAECIDLTESTVWSGAPSDADVNETALENLGHIRQLMFAERYSEARELSERHLLGTPKSFGTHLPLVALKMTFPGDSPAKDYCRSLCLDDGIAYSAYTRDDCRFHREIFASNPDDLLIVRHTCDQPHSVELNLSFAKSTLPGEVTVTGEDTLVFRGHAFEHMHSNGQQGVAFEARVRLLSEGGNITTGDSTLRVAGATAAMVHVAISTNLRGADPSELCAKTLQHVRNKSYAQLRTAHVQDHHSLFSRVSIDLGSNPSAETKPTDERRKAVQSGESDPGLAALFFQYGRYLTIAGSRANSPLPLALQGIWNDGLASSMGWTDDFHLDINTQQNYWVAEVGNLAECQSPLFNFIESMSVAGRSTARKMYGAPGWVAHVVTNPWGYTAPGWGLGWGLFPTGGVWLALQMWEHYRFTKDKQFLRDRVYPVYKQAAEFFLNYMVEHPQRGWLVTGPAGSPENSFIAPDGKSYSESMGPTADRVLVYALLSACVEASATLAVDADFRARAKNALDRLPPLQIGRHGQLQEWLEDYEDAQPNHRHTSHLIALYPEDQISPSRTPALARAARVTIERRTSQPDWEDSEWSRANLVNYFARLLDGESAHKHVIGLLAHATEDSLLTYSRGGVAGAESNIFALDGNTAGAAGIAEMLLQSQAEEVHLLPALPSAWPNGKVSGLRARGAIEVSIVWTEGKLFSAKLKSEQAGTHSVRYGTTVVPCALKPGQEIELSALHFHRAGTREADGRE